MAHIVVEGPIGVGKTTLAHRLAETFEAALVLEVVEDNPFLAPFYGDPERFAFPVQAYFLLSRYRQAADVEQGMLFHRDVVGDYLFDKDWVFASMNLEGAEWDLYQGLYQALRPRLSKPDLVVHLNAGVDVLLDRISRRGRPFEASVDPSYLERLIDAYARFFRTYDGHVLHVDAGSIDIVGDPGDLDALIRAVAREVHASPQPANA